MSVLVKGMKMPEGCFECKFQYDYMCCLATGKYWFGSPELPDFNAEAERLPDCPLVEIPKHGDLIDRKALFNGEHNLYSWADIEEAPVVIPAEDSKT